MKDYYDCYRMIDESVLDIKLLKEALRETASNRGTELNLIPENTEPFSDLWSNFLRGNDLDELDMNEVIKLINYTIQKVF